MRISDWSSDVCSSDLEVVACHLAGVDDGLCDRDREGDDFAECVAIENPELVRSSDFDKMLAAGLIPTSIVRKGVGRDAELGGHVNENRGGGAFACLQRTARPLHGYLGQEGK